MDKIVLKVIGIFVLILGILYCISIVGIIIGVPLIIGGNKFISYSNMTDEKILENKDSILGWSIFFLFVTIIGGLLGLIYYFTISGSIDRISDSISNLHHDTKYLDELTKLKELYDNRAITKEEYEYKKKQILKM